MIVHIGGKNLDSDAAWCHWLSRNDVKTSQTIFCAIHGFRAKKPGICKTEIEAKTIQIQNSSNVPKLNKDSNMKIFQLNFQKKFGRKLSNLTRKRTQAFALWLSWALWYQGFCPNISQNFCSKSKIQGCASKRASSIWLTPSISDFNGVTYITCLPVYKHGHKCQTQNHVGLSETREQH